MVIQMNKVIYTIITPLVSALFFVSILAVSNTPSAAAKNTLQDQVKPLTKELLNTKVPNFYCFEYHAQPQPGKRYWLRISSTKWVERYPDGTETIFRVLGHGTVKDTLGTIVYQVNGDSSKTQTEGAGGLLAFIPDKGSSTMHHWYRNNDRGDTDWHDLGKMLSVE
jgi:hypothetical protein